MPPDVAPLHARTHALTQWFERHARPFPWRERRTPYRVWIAEAMLQQTRAATVVAYYEAWMTRFPNLDTLATAHLDDVLAVWQGLGYYRRARALHEAARRIHHDHDGAFPTTEADWRALPGIGSYTAAAIAAFAHGARTIAVDANVRRVAARLLAQPAPSDVTIRDALLPLLPNEHPERGTEALIELGATLCTPRSPHCRSCPLAAACRAHHLGDTDPYPAKRPKRPPTPRYRYALVHLRGNELLLQRRPEDGLLGGLWGFPQCQEQPSGRTLATIRHAYTHVTLHLTPVITTDTAPCTSDAGTLREELDDTHAPSTRRWVDVTSLTHLALSTVDRRILDALQREGLLASTA